MRQRDWVTPEGRSPGVCLGTAEAGGVGMTLPRQELKCT